MERLRYRSTSAVDLIAELHQAELLAEARRLDAQRGMGRHRGAIRVGIRRLLRLRS
jgi:hypothetical protein